MHFRINNIKITISLSLLLFLCYPSLTCASFNKYPYNPVLPYDSPNAWESKGRLMPTVIYDEGVYKMWYGGYNGSFQSLGYATSNEGVKWKLFENNPVLKPDLTYEKHISENSVIRDNDLFKIWFTVQLITGNYVIKYAISNDGKEWFRQNVYGLDVHKWEDNNNIYAPTVIKINENKYIMLYNAKQNNIWKIGYADSIDGITWYKTAYPVIEPTENWEKPATGRPWMIYYKNNNLLEVFYHSSDPTVIGHAYSTDQGKSWNKQGITNPILVRGPDSYDSTKINAPSVVIDPNNQSVLHMWYGGYNGNNNQWSIGYATTGEFPVIRANPVVIIPGMFASWNSSAILEGEEVPQSDWVTSPFVKDYEGIIKTLESAGYISSPSDPKQNLFIFNYDWRKSLEETALDLKNYLNNVVFPKNPNTTVYLVGHSLGGLVGRTYLQMFDNYQVEQLITLGTPHSGAIQAYKAWEGGVVDSNNPWEKLALEIVLGVNRNGFRTNKDVIREIVPVVHNLLPTFDYLVKQPFSVDIPVTSQIQQNNLLPNLETNFSDYYARFYSFVGENGQTPEKYIIAQPNIIENKLGLWQDGKPIDTQYTASGDEVVLTKSATRNDDTYSTFPNISHRNLVSEQEVITKLMDKLDAEPQAIITPPAFPPLIPSLIFALRSPAELEVNGPLGKYQSEDNQFILIADAQSGTYQIDVKGTSAGRYHLLIGEINENKSTWQDIVGTTNSNEIDTYTMTYNSDSPLPYPITDQNGQIYLNSALTKIEELKEKYPNWTLTLAIQSINKINDQITTKKYKRLEEYFKNTIKYLFQFRKKQTIAYPFNTAYSAIEDLVIAYDKILTLASAKPNKIKILTEISVVNGLKIGLLEKIKYLGNEQKAESYNLGEQILNQAQKDYTTGNLHKADIEILIARLLFLEI